MSRSLSHNLSTDPYSLEEIAWSPDGRCLASGVIGVGVQLWANGFNSLLTMPLACYGEEQWELLSNLQKKSFSLEAWQRLWLEFIVVLSSLMRRFDVSLDDLPIKLTSPEYEIEID